MADGRGGTSTHLPGERRERRAGTESPVRQSLSRRVDAHHEIGRPVASSGLPARQTTPSKAIPARAPRRPRPAWMTLICAPALSGSGRPIHPATSMNCSSTRPTSLCRVPRGLSGRRRRNDCTPAALTPSHGEPSRDWLTNISSSSGRGHSPALRLRVCLVAALSTDAISRSQWTRVVRLVTKPRGFRGPGLN